MRKIILLILIILLSFSLKVDAQEVCCKIQQTYPEKYTYFKKTKKDDCTINKVCNPVLGKICSVEILDVEKCNEQIKTRPGEVIIKWETTSINICPPGIFGISSCQYPDIQDVIKEIIDFVLDISPFVLVILIIIGGLTYMLSVFNPQMIQIGHKYIQWAIYGYIILLLVTLIFSFISFIFGGPSLE